jgi:hypothetical protein
MTIQDLKNAQKTRGRPFPAANRGRPRGAKNRKTRFVEALLEKDIEDIAKAVSTAAKAGDMAAAKLVLDRLAPARRGRPVQFEAPASIDAQSLRDAFSDIVARLAVGEMTPEEGIAVANVLELGRKTVETVELEERLRVVEAQLARPPLRVV